MTCCIEVHLFNLPLRVRMVRRKVKTPFSQAQAFSPSFLAVSGLVFTGCFICLIYVPCPDCCMGPGCSSHMAVQHALMRCPISRNTNRVLRPSLWLYDVWTHKSFPETPDLGRTKPDQARGPSVYFWGGLFSVTWLTIEQYIKKRRLQSWGDWNFFSSFSDSAFYFLAGNFTAKQYWLRLHTGIVFVACHNGLIQHQEALGTIRASYNSSTIILKISSYCSFKVNHGETHHPVPYPYVTNQKLLIHAPLPGSDCFLFSFCSDPQFRLPDQRTWVSSS